MAAKQMEEIQKKVRKISYPRANAPAQSQSLLFAGMERYALLEWLFFKLISLFLSDFIFLLIPEQCGGEFPLLKINQTSEFCESLIKNLELVFRVGKLTLCLISVQCSIGSV